MGALTADVLVSKTLVRCFWKATTAPLTSAEILDLADEVIAGELWPLVVASGGDYYLSYTDYSIVDDQIKYRLPAKAYGPIRDVLHIDLTDDQDVGRSIPMIGIEELGRSDRLGPTDSRYYHYFDGDYIGLWPTPELADNTLRIRYYRHPNKLALVAACGLVSARATVASTFDQLTYSGADLSGGVPNAEVEIDVIGQGNAHQIIYDLPAANAIINTTTATTLLTVGWGDTTVGDYLALSGFTPLVQLPDFMHPLLVRLTAAACLRAHGEHDNADREAAAASLLYERAQTTILPRSEAEPNIIVTRNTPLRAARRMWR